MLGIGANELVLILIFGFIIFGPDKLPAMAKTIGQAIARFRRAQSEMADVLKNGVYDPDSEDPFKNPLDAMADLERKAGEGEGSESFSQRKARYDRQREAERRNEERKAEIAARKAQARARMEGAGSEPEGDEGASPVAGCAPEAQPAPCVSVEELYGIKPIQPAGAAQAAGGTASAEAACGSVPADRSVKGE